MQEENDSTTSQLRHLRSELKQIQTDKSDVDDRLIRVSEREKEDEIKIATLHVKKYTGTHTDKRTN